MVALWPLADALIPATLATPQIAQGKQRVQLLRVPGQPLLTHLHFNEVAIDDSARIFDPSVDAGLARNMLHAPVVCSGPAPDVVGS